MPTPDYRRKLSRQEELRALGTAAGVAAGLGVAALYLTRIWMQREPLRRTEAPVVWMGAGERLAGGSTPARPPAGSDA